MEGELERSSRQNALLELNIDEIRQKLKATEKEMFSERQKVCEASYFSENQTLSNEKKLHVLQFYTLLLIL